MLSKSYFIEFYSHASMSLAGQFGDAEAIDAAERVAEALGLRVMSITTDHNHKVALTHRTVFPLPETSR